MTPHCPTCGQRLGPGEWGMCAGCGWDSGWECAGCGRTVDEVSPGEASGLCVACWDTEPDGAA